jgi:hypothetical protein
MPTTTKKPLWQKLMTKSKRKEKVMEMKRMEKARRKILIHATSVELRGTSKTSIGRKILHKCLKNYKRKKTKKAGAAVEEEHLLSIVDICDNVSMVQVDIEAAYVSPLIIDSEM